MEKETINCENCPTHNPTLKCCTFYPFLPNYLVGAVLKSELPGRGVVYQLLKEKKYTLPIGIVAPPAYQKLFYDTQKEGFGESKDLLCPFYDKINNNCGVWEYRSSECSTYFCDALLTKDTRKMWKDLRSKLYKKELAFSQDVMLHSGYSNNEIQDNLNEIKREAEDCEDKWSLNTSEAKSFWHHVTDYEDYYISAFNYVNSVR